MDAVFTFLFFLIPVFGLAHAHLEALDADTPKYY